MKVLFLFLTLLPGVAHGLDVQRRDEGEVVVVSALLPHAIADVRALLAQGETTMRIGKETRHVETRLLPNGCTELVVVSRGFGKDLRYTAERCPTPDGFYSKMTASEDFDVHDIRWSMAIAGTGTEVTIRVHVKPKILVPHFVVRHMVGGALGQTLTKMNVLLEQRHLAK